MGTCVGKDEKPPGALGNDLVQQRRLTALTAPACERSGPPVDVLSALVSGRKKLSVHGCASACSQKGFADKRVETEGFTDDSLSGFKVGWSCKKGLKPESPNQDDFCIFRVDATSIYGVFDGHGPSGHDVSNFVQQVLCRNFARHPHFMDNPEKALSDAFVQTQTQCLECQADGQLDCSLSGTTATLAMLREGVLHMAHVGDSRAVLAKECGTELVSEDLTHDHKPTCEGEKKRIEAMGGEVRRLDGDIPHRVFLRGKKYPGLAMTRAIGDSVGATAGVTSIPEVGVFDVREDWRFMLLCSDGVWEFMSSQEAVDTVSKFSAAEAQKAAEALAVEAWTRWIQEEGNVVDDITVLCAWFHDS